MDQVNEEQENRLDASRWKAPFFTIWTGQAFSLFGSSLVQFALVWWLTQTTGSATVLTTAALVAILPGIFLSPFSGALVDRWSRRAVMALSDTLTALTTVALVFLFLTGTVQTWHIYVALFVRAASGGFQFPAMQASTSLMVPREHLARVAGLNQALQGGLSIVAPPTGALLLTLLPMHWVLSIDILTAALAIIPLLFIRIPQPARTGIAGGEQNGIRALLGEVRAGIRYVAGWPGLIGIVALATVLNFMVSPVTALTPLLVTRHFGGGALQLGWTDSAFGIGVVLGGLALGAWGGFKRQIKTTLLGCIGFGLGILLVGLAPSSAFWLGLSGMALSGFMNPLVNGPVAAILQKKVAPDMQGRVLSLVVSLATAMTPISMLLAGPASDYLGLQFWFRMAGIVCALMGVAGFLIPAVMSVEDRQDTPQPETSGQPGNHRVVEASNSPAD